MVREKVIDPLLIGTTQMESMCKWLTLTTHLIVSQKVIVILRIVAQNFSTPFFSVGCVSSCLITSRANIDSNIPLIVWYL